jgi:hypothetical protein
LLGGGTLERQGRYERGVYFSMAACPNFVVIRLLGCRTASRTEVGLSTDRFPVDICREGLLPGFRDGYERIHRDETRHVG